MEDKNSQVMLVYMCMYVCMYVCACVRVWVSVGACVGKRGCMDEGQELHYRGQELTGEGWERTHR